MSLLLSFGAYAVAFIVAIGVLVSVHEYGHYRVAKSFGIKILTFSIGFGRPLLSWKRGETDWQLAVIPLGGYVKMLDEREAPVPAAELDRAFNRQSVGRRMAVVVAGPLANLLLAVLVYWAIFLAGVEITIPRVGAVAAGSAAALAGLSVGDTIVAVNQAPVDNWADVQLAFVDAAAAEARLDLLVKSADQSEHHRRFDLAGFDRNKIDGDVPESLGFSLAAATVMDVVSGSPAARAGILPGDQPISVDGQPTFGTGAFVAAIQSKPGTVVRISMMRKHQRLDFNITPNREREGGREIGRIGAAVRGNGEVLRQLVGRRVYGPFGALRQAFVHTWETMSFTLRMMWRLVTGHLPVKSLSGPVAIAKYAGQTAQLGLRYYVDFLALISISLGVLNLLPIPVLDGGHLLYYSSELLRGRPLSERAMELGQRVGVGILAVMMAVAMFNDISRLVGS